MIYLDHNATTPLDEAVLAAMLPFLSGRYGNPSSAHRAGRTAREAVATARETVAELLGANDREVIFTGGGTESDNLAIRGVMHAAPAERPHLISSSTEHSAVLSTIRSLQADRFEADLLPVDAEGHVDTAQADALLTDRTALLSVHQANNETGCLQPIAALAEAAHRHGALAHTDSIQAVGKVPVRLDTLGVDLLSISAHKFGGPQGVGALVGARGTRLAPILFGGHQERDRRAGTENVAGIVGLAEALRLAVERVDRSTEALARLTDRLYQKLDAALDGVRLNGPVEGRVPNTINLGFDRLDGTALMHRLDLEGIAVSTGSACASGSPEPSHVLLAMGCRADEAQSAIRFSLSHTTTEPEIDTVIATLLRLVPALRDQASF